MKLYYIYINYIVVLMHFKCLLLCRRKKPCWYFWSFIILKIALLVPVVRCSNYEEEVWEYFLQVFAEYCWREWRSAWWLKWDLSAFSNVLPKDLVCMEEVREKKYFLKSGGKMWKVDVVNRRGRGRNAIDSEWFPKIVQKVEWIVYISLRILLYIIGC